MSDAGRAAPGKTGSGAPAIAPGDANALGRPPAVRVRDLRKTYASAVTATPALDGVSLRIEAGEMVGLIGPSGSGKSTLLRHLTGLTRSDAGTGLVEVFGRPVQQSGQPSPDLRRTRRDIGFIFQQFNLVDRLSLLTNVLIGRLAHIPFYRRYTGRFTVDEVEQAMTALDRVGIGAHAGQQAGTLSGGQQQRAAIARAMVQQARLILADEPIASLDPEASRKVMEALSVLNRQDGATVVVCLHQVEFARKFCRRIVALKDGKIVFDGRPAALGIDLLTAVYGAEAGDAGLLQPREPSAPPAVRPAALARAGMA